MPISHTHCYGRGRRAPMLRAVLACLIALTHSQDSTEGSVDDPDCDPMPNSGSCLGFLFQDRTLAEEQNWALASAGGYHTCAIQKGDERIMACFGRGTEGQKEIPIKGGWANISSGWKHTCALRLDSSLSCWGDNRFGQISVPSKLQMGRNATGWFLVSSGQKHTCAISLPSYDVLWFRV
jgi:hypothetical protein